MINFIARRRLGRLLLAGAAGALLAALVSYSDAAAFQLVPLSQTFEPTGRGSNQVFQVENDRNEPVTVTISMAKRTVDIDGKETLERTEDFTLFPTEVVLPPKSTRAIRAKWVGDPAPRSELTYRIIAEETPVNSRRATPGGSVLLAVRYLGTVYVAPKGARANLVVASARPLSGPRGQQLELVLENKGTRHALLEEPALTITAGGITRTVDRTAIAEVLDGENVLAGGQRRFLLSWPAELPSGTPVTGTIRSAVR